MFNLDATIAALEILRIAKRQTCNGPDAAFRIVFHAYDRLDAELSAYLRGADTN